VYPGCSGLRYRRDLHKARAGYLADLDPQAAHGALSGWFGRDPGQGAAAVAATEEIQESFGPAWVAQEITRFRIGGAPKPVIAGLGLGIPGGEQADTADNIAACAEGCYDAGAAGILLSRHLHEMTDDLIAAAGSVIRRRQVR
jgi:hypothetical protein